MDLIIYEDQTGLMQFPDKRSEKDSKIVNFFNNNIDLYIDKVGNNLTIYCHLIAFKASTRPLGYYIIGRDIYSDNIFVNFKKDVDKILKSLELQPRTGHVDNTIFENIERFDDRYQYYKEDIDIVKDVISYGRNLEYSAGDIREVSAFCKDMLRKTNNIKISISSTKNNLGNINILINKKSSESLKRTDSTEQIINQQREMLREKKKAEEGAPGIIKIREGFDKIKEGADILKNAGYNNLEIRNEIDRKVSEITIKFPTYVERREPEKREKIEVPIKKLEVTDDSKDKDIEIGEDTTKSHIKIILAIFGIVTILAIVIVFRFGILSADILPDNIRNYIGLTPEPTETPVIEETFTPLPTETPEPTETPVINNKNNISNGTNGTNNNKSSINITNNTKKDKNDTANGSVPIITPIPAPTNILPNGTQNALIPT